MTFLGRLKFYGVGFGIGLLMVFAIFGQRSCTTPNEIKMQQLVFQYMEFSEKAQCKLKCNRKNETLLKIELRHFEINYDLSDVHKEPCGEYYIQPKKEYDSLYNYKLIIYDCDTISRIKDISFTSTTTCTCP
ncbi:hypothetical protein [Aurantibacillus circumpalustris]|uniref:hypothetical protein n=1 Tax=Aurantibacillus circumpalustris TaxID=3036359 RepID=UPI00295C1A6D|nr:hypothetical protein [Aurantibacillus circumpalustris]